MSSLRAIKITDAQARTLRVEFDGTDLWAEIHGAEDGEIPTVELDDADRKDLRDFLSSAT